MDVNRADVLASIKARCVEEGDCWIWQGALSATGYPIFKPPGAKGCLLVRRWVQAGKVGYLLKPRQPVVTTCNDRRCVCPDHLRASTVSDVSKAAAARGAFSGVARAAKIAMAKRAVGKINADIAAIIFNSDESGPVLSARYGVARSLVNRIKTGKAWKQYGANPFSGLMR